MKKCLQIFFAITLILSGAQTVCAQNNNDNEYYWVSNGGDWNDLNNWVVRLPYNVILPAGELPDATNNVYFGFTPGDPRTNSFTTNSVTITVGNSGPAPLNSPAARSINFIGTPPADFILRFEINQPLTVAESFTVNYPVTITANNALNIGGPVTVNSATTITANNELIIGGSLTMADAAARLAINRPVKVGGSLILTSSGNLTGTTGSLTFTSTAKDTQIKSPGGVTFNVPVVFNGVGGRWTIQDNITIGVSARFTNGHVVALPLSVANQNPFNPNAALPPMESTTAPPDPKFIFTTNATATVDQPGHQSHVIGYVQKKEINQTTLDTHHGGLFTFPIGDGKYYRPLSMFQPSGSINNWTARYLSVDPVANTGASNTNYAPPINSVSNREFWYLTASSSANTRFTLSYLHPEETVRDYYNMAKWAGITVASMGLSANGKNATWSDRNGLPSPPPLAGTGTVSTQEAMSSSTPWFTIARRGPHPLPVRLVSFTAQLVEGRVQLKWQSASEENTDHFVVEKSQDGKNFSEVLTRKAQGNSTALVAYSALDQTPYSGTSYYRLKMVDLDGSFEYSRLVMVSGEGIQLQVRAYPNPSNGKEIRLIALNGDKLVLQSVMDVFGKVMQYETVNLYVSETYVNFFQSLPAGLYVANLITDDDKRERVQVKFIVQ